MEKRKTFSRCNFFEHVYKEGNWKVDVFEEKTKQKTEAGKVSITDFKSSPVFDIDTTYIDADVESLDEEN